MSRIRHQSLLIFPTDYVRRARREGVIGLQAKLGDTAELVCKHCKWSFPMVRRPIWSAEVGRVCLIGERKPRVNLEFVRYRWCDDLFKIRGSTKYTVEAIRPLCLGSRPTSRPGVVAWGLEKAYRVDDVRLPQCQLGDPRWRRLSPTSSITPRLLHTRLKLINCRVFNFRAVSSALFKASCKVL